MRQVLVRFIFGHHILYEGLFQIADSALGVLVNGVFDLMQVFCDVIHIRW